MLSTIIWYCLECGNYSYQAPRLKSALRGVWVCDLCKEDGVVDMERKPSKKLRNLIEDMKAAAPSGSFDDTRPYYRPLNYLLDTISLAKYFINVATESMDAFFLGVLSLKQSEPEIEQRVILWHPQRLYGDFDQLMDHSMIIKGFQRRENLISRGLRVATVSKAHQKLFVIDGVVAFKGSANASLDAWTDQGNIIELVTDPLVIQNLNRRYFASYMAKKRTVVDVLWPKMKAE
jgi:phosphatidylserine/phosphatidylglycerophosphate/cardiolipin synthase-like enzyme